MIKRAKCHYCCKEYVCPNVVMRGGEEVPVYVCPTCGRIEAQERLN